MFSLLQTVILGFLLYIGVYTLLDRICKCAEKVTELNSFALYNKALNSEKKEN